MSDPSIERVTDLDAAWPELVALFSQFEDYNAGFLTRTMRPDWQQRWREHLTLDDDRLVLLARLAGGEAVGYLIAGISRDVGLFDEAFARVSDLFVRAPYRDGRLGRELAKRAEAWAIERGISEMRIEVYSANKPGVRFWTYSGYSLDAMVMKKSLVGGAS